MRSFFFLTCSFFLLFMANTRAQSHDAALISKTQTVVADLRKLSFLRPVNPEEMSSQNLRNVVMACFRREYPLGRLNGQQVAFRKFGIVPPTTDIGSAWAEILGGNPGVFYDARQKKIYFPLVRTKYQLPKLMEYTLEKFSLPLEQIMMTHHLTMVLLGQHYPVLSLPAAKLGNDDLSLALESLWHGDAMNTMMEHMLGKLHLNPNQLDTSHDFLQNIPLAGLGSHRLFKLPPFFRERMSFPALKGWNFVKETKQYRGTEYLDHMYQNDLPCSTEQILHPSKFYGKRDNPIQVSQSGLAHLLGPGWRETYRNTLGEFMTGLVLSRHFPADQARHLASGWGGDQYVVYVKNRQVAVVYYSTWDTEYLARRFFNAYRKLISAKYKGISFHNDTEDRKTPELMGRLQGEGFYLGLREKDVLMVESVPFAFLEKLIPSAWQVEKKEIVAGYADLSSRILESLHGFSIRTPSSHWEVKWKDSKKVPVTVDHSLTASSLKISKLPETVSMEEMVVLLRKGYSQKIPSLVWLADQAASAGKESGHLFRYRVSPRSPVCEQWIFKGKGFFYLIVLDRFPELDEKASKEMQQILDSFRLH